MHNIECDLNEQFLAATRIVESSWQDLMAMEGSDGVQVHSWRAVRQAVNQNLEAVDQLSVTSSSITVHESLSVRSPPSIPVVSKIDFTDVIDRTSSSSAPEEMMTTSAQGRWLQQSQTQATSTLQQVYSMEETPYSSGARGEKLPSSSYEPPTMTPFQTTERYPVPDYGYAYTKLKCCCSLRDYDYTQTLPMSPICPAGDKGPPGVKGDPGEPGMPGSNGYDGEPAHYVLRPYAPPYLDSKDFCPLCPAGPPGLTGPKGAMGYRGHRGLRGVPGAPGLHGQPGLIGATGDVGERGRPGIKGYKGSRGSYGIVSSKGKPGNPGPPGSPGVPGPRGIGGAPGDYGPMGKQGPVGPPGVQGPPGADGLDGNVGREGPQGKNGPHCPCSTNFYERYHSTKNPERPLITTSPSVAPSITPAPEYQSLQEITPAKTKFDYRKRSVPVERLLKKKKVAVVEFNRSD
ncbi:Collagen triple helix repeat protein [Trichostrongylus colubriformis]|uniref:Collagen triple helix repeat protein n=1 Tax=Trichostrongylus colubriformis TaxID=6319 RepID=A0AAN8IBC5_TRICO